MKSSCRVTIFALGVLLLIIPGAWPAPNRASMPPPENLAEILEFDRKFCPVCREAEMIIQEVLREYPGRFVVSKRYIDETPNIFRRYHVDIVPTQMFLDPSGKEVFRHEGVFPKDQLIRKLKELRFIPNGGK